ncbi:MULTISPECIES: type VI secretion system lipoprotein TssJ [unclassified Massilia]|uniref:type VI secretion system lipoprotein TssJ n=1 Tax=unclassified Massilia TaxID=2609279 RepID=UPI00177D992D|nr:MULTISPECIES: type VI secretion system lipoprotein TssJ [unclassified Massilia]MBD8531172.1 type VI secretion system lipoprotein TssJ [Massilia sp. CFBP 13647]MBD8675008.1 type VI secretion system lipoprotein TssJ [Massilia sp. CFBP 13721]
MPALPSFYLSSFCLSLLLAALPGCAGDAARKAAQAEQLKAPRNVALRLHAAPKLNVDARGRPLAVVARIYTLRQNAAFDAAPYATFLTPGRDREAFGADLLEVKDVTLVPGQRYDTVEKLPREAAYVGIVALFHSPAPQRWRMSFATTEAESAGVNVAVQACALSPGAGAKPSAAATMAPGSVRCQ